MSHTVTHPRSMFEELRSKSMRYHTYDSNRHEAAYALCFQAPIEMKKDGDGVEYAEIVTSEATPVNRSMEHAFYNQFQVTALAQAIENDKLEQPYLKGIHQKGLSKFSGDLLTDATEASGISVSGAYESDRWSNPAERHRHGENSICYALNLGKERMYPIDYSLLEDRQAFGEECDKHDGVMRVYSGGANCRVSMSTGDKDFKDKLWKELNERGLSEKVFNGGSYVWVDNIERQIARSSEEHPSVKHKDWTKNMEAFRLRCKENIENAKKMPEIEQQAEKAQEKDASKLVKGKR